GCRPVFRRHALDDARGVDDRALMRPSADLLGAVHGPNAEEDLAAVGARDFRMAYHLAPDRRRHEVAHIDTRTDCTLAPFEILLYGIQGRVFHDENQVRRREHWRQGTVLEPVREMCRLNPKRILAPCAVRNRFHRIPGMATVFSGAASRWTSAAHGDFGSARESCGRPEPAARFPQRDLPKRMRVLTLRLSASKAKGPESDRRTSTRRCLQ